MSTLSTLEQSSFSKLSMTGKSLNKYFPYTKKIQACFRKVTSLLLICSIFTIPSFGLSLSEKVNLEVQRSIEENLPGSQYAKLKIPKFLTSYNNKAVGKIEVTFPSNIHSERLIAQVWLQTTDNKKTLVAIPIQITSGESKVSVYSLASRN